MKHNYLLFSYHRLQEKYRKYFSRLQRHLRKGTFAGLSASRKNFLVRKVEELRAQLLSLQPKLAGTIAAASFMSALCLSEAEAQPFVYNTQKNPFYNGIQTSFVQTSYGEAYPAVADLDDDGDQDVLITNYMGAVYYYKNTGTQSAPAFTLQTGTNNPMNNVPVNTLLSLALADMDGDGDFDLVAGGDHGGTGQIITYYKNTGTVSSPAFTIFSGTNSPFPPCSGYTGFGSAAVVDIDGDLDNDVFLADGKYGVVYFFKNTGTATSPTFIQTTSGNPFPTGDVTPTGANGYLFTTFTDIDGDGNQDAVMGPNYSEIIWYKNTGTSTAAVMTLVTGTNNPFPGFTGNWQSPAFADMDHDGTLDLILGDSYVTSIYYNAGTAQVPKFPKPVDVGYIARARFADIDGDGDLDAIFSAYPSVAFWINNGPATKPVFTAVTGTSSPFNNIQSYIANTFADIDGDKDLDLMIGSYDSTFTYYQNTGTTTAAVYTKQTGINSPVNGLNTGHFNSTPVFVDLDGDRDQDLISGAYDGTLTYFQNTGTTTAAAFTQQTGTNNPFNGMISGTYSYPTFVNFDGDGDMDLLVGTKSNGLLYYRNNGSATSPVFTAITGTHSPFDFINTNYTTNGMYYGPAFMDVDADNDLDLFVSQVDGTVKLYVNQSKTAGILSPKFSSFGSIVEAYPNPVKDILNFSLNDAIGSTMQVSVLDMKGMEMLNKSVENTGSAMKLNVSSLNTGMYMLRLSSDSKVAMLKFVKQ